MNEHGSSGNTLEIDALRQIGAAKFDPVRFFYLEVLARSTMAHQGPVKRLLEDKLAQALVTLRDNFEQAQTDTRQAVDLAARQYTQAAADLQRLYEGGDFTAVRQSISRLAHGVHGTPLGELARDLSQHRPPDVADSVGSTANTGLHPELTATQYFRKTWTKLSIDKRVTQALGQAPKNAGPINSHMLVLRSLALMRDISPDYLNRLTGYVDTLLCLDHCGKQKQATAKKATDAASTKKMRSRTARRPV